MAIEDSQEADQNNTILGGADTSQSNVDQDKKPEEGDKEPTDGEKNPGEEKPEEDEGSQNAPESYEDFTFPEGVKVNEDILGKFTSLAKEFNLNQENAQKLMDIASENASAIDSAQQNEWSSVREGWVKEIKTDKEFGGDKFTETVTRAKRTIEKFFDKDVLAFLDSSGYGDHPGLLKGLSRIDAATGEDKVVDGKPGESEKTLAERVYGKK